MSPAASTLSILFVFLMRAFCSEGRRMIFLYREPVEIMISPPAAARFDAADEFEVQRSGSGVSEVSLWRAPDKCDPEPAKGA